MINWLLVLDSFYTGEHKTLILVLLVLVVIVFAIIFVLLCLLVYGRKFRLLLNEIIEKIEIIRKLPLSHRLFRISEIANHSTYLQENLKIWKLKYEIIYDKKFVNFIDQLSKILSGHHLTQRYHKLQVMSERIDQIKHDCDALLEELERHLQIEGIQRNYILIQKNIFNTLMIDSKKMQFNSTVGLQKLKLFTESLVEMFNNFNLELVSGNFAQSNQILNNITSSLKIFAEILERLPQLLEIIHDVIPQKITSLKKQAAILSELKRGGKNNFNNLFEKLTTSVDAQIKEANLLVNNLQYKKAVRIVTELLMNVNWIETDLSYQVRQVTCYKTYYKLIQKYVEEMRHNATVFLQNFGFLKVQNDLTPDDDKTFKLIIELNQNLSRGISELIINSPLKVANDNYYALLVLIKQLLEMSLTMNSYLATADALIRQKNKKRNQIYTDLHNAEVSLLQVETRLNRINYESLLNIYEPKINLIWKKVSAIKVDKKSSAYNNDQFTEHATKIIQEIFVLFKSIRQDVILDQMLQESILYLHQKLIQSDKFATEINELQTSYNQISPQKGLDVAIKLMLATREVN